MNKLAVSPSSLTVWAEPRVLGQMFACGERTIVTSLSSDRPKNSFATVGRWIPKVDPNSQLRPLQRSALKQLARLSEMHQVHRLIRRVTI